ncbi:cation/H(+) antiporter 15-like [Tasmannia lanceolata]|uniref:cation/H(+) antiporter 15-like n=1 Tax=Tasmannia lanceolata TaxID=3420 RepID=UPI0040635786
MHLTALSEPCLLHPSTNHYFSTGLNISDMAEGTMAVSRVNAAGVWNEMVVCFDPTKTTSNGIWLKDDALKFSLPLLMVQITLVFISTRTVRFLLRPLSQPTIVSDILGGMILGPSVLGLKKTVSNRLFPPSSYMLLDTAAILSSSFFMFLIAVKMDLSIIRKSGKRAFGIAISVNIFPAVLATLTNLILWNYIPTELKKSALLPSLTVVLSMTFFPVVACLLFDLKILSSQLGRLGVTVAMVCDIYHMALSVIISALKFKQGSTLITIYSAASLMSLILSVVFIVRPVSVWIALKARERKHVRDIHILLILVGVVLSLFICEVIGQEAHFGPLLIGLAIPDGPPLGAAIVERLDSIISGVFFPIFFAFLGLHTNVFAIQDWTIVGIVMFMFLIGTIAKVIGTLLPSLYCKIPIRDASALGLILSSKGFNELLILEIWRRGKVVDEQTFTIVIFGIVLVSGITAPLIKALYKPSMGYRLYKRRTIQNTKLDSQFRLLTCVYHEYHAPSLITLLELSHPTKKNPIYVYVLHLIQLIGRSSPLLIAHKEYEPSSHYSLSEHIINAFKSLENGKEKLLWVHPFTSVTPHVSMHDDICMLAFKNRVSLIILPFHKQQEVDGTMGSANRIIQVVNRHVLDLAPCSVGILIDRGFTSKGLGTYGDSVSHNMAVLFLGGSDDREALAFAMTMAENPSANITLVRFMASNEDKELMNSRQKRLDEEMVNEFKHKISVTEKNGYQENVVDDGEATMNVIRSMRNFYDIFLVGKGEWKESTLTSGLMQWNECKELGIIGDILASSDFGGTVSVLVVQRQAKVGRKVV